MMLTSFFGDGVLADEINAARVCVNVLGDLEFLQQNRRPFYRSPRPSTHPM